MDIYSLEQILAANLSWNAARIKFLTRFLVALGLSAYYAENEQSLRGKGSSALLIPLANSLQQFQDWCNIFSNQHFKEDY